MARRRTTGRRITNIVFSLGFLAVMTLAIINAREVQQVYATACMEPVLQFLCE